MDYQDKEFEVQKEQIHLGDPKSVLWACGKNNNSELGIAGINYIDTPSGVKGLSRTGVIQVSPGKDHTAIMDETGAVFMMGSNLHEKLGIDLTNFNNKAKPTPLPLS